MSEMNSYALSQSEERRGTRETAESMAAEDG